MSLTTSAAALLVSLTLSAEPEYSGPPSSMAALGDSITQATNAGAFGNRPARSWSTGTDTTVQSHYLRLLALEPGINGYGTNLSVSGAQIDDLPGQATAAVAD